MPASPRVRGSHPLEIIPLFRHWAPSPLRDLAYTVLWSSLIGLVLTTASGAFMGKVRALPYLLGAMLLTSNVIGFMIHGALATLRLLAPAAFAQRRWPMLLCQLTVFAGCAVLGIALSDALWSGISPVAILGRTNRLVSLLPFGLVIALVTITVLTTIARRQAREAEAARQQEKIAEASRLVAEAKLRALQAQIEPHFLYNTLANVVSLIGSDPDRAKHMLERLIDFLRASLSASRAEHATVGAEFDLARAYLDVLAVRLGPRLGYRIEVDDAVRVLPVAPMLVQPLVENAVMHGIERKVEGGTVVIRASYDKEALCIEVSDDGAGLASVPPRPGGGVGLANLRERLQGAHGAQARVQLIENQHAGVTARLLLPLPR